MAGDEDLAEMQVSVHADAPGALEGGDLLVDDGEQAIAVAQQERRLGGGEAKAGGEG